MRKIGTNNMEHNKITPEEQSKLNKEFGRSIADIMLEFGMTKCPWVLNLEQADALRERWKELQKQQRTMRQKTENYKKKHKNRK